MSKPQLRIVTGKPQAQKPKPTSTSSEYFFEMKLRFQITPVPGGVRVDTEGIFDLYDAECQDAPPVYRRQMVESAIRRLEEALDSGEFQQTRRGPVPEWVEAQWPAEPKE